MHIAISNEMYTWWCAMVKLPNIRGVSFNWNNPQYLLRKPFSGWIYIILPSKYFSGTTMGLFSAIDRIQIFDEQNNTPHMFQETPSSIQHGSFQVKI